MQNEQTEHVADFPLAECECVPLQDIVAGQEAKSAATAAAPLLFRGKPIAWVEVPQKETIRHENAFGDDYIEERQSGVRHLITYENRNYTREEFLKFAFPDYKRSPYKVNFKTDDIFRLGGNQRAKLQYHILAQKFLLVAVDEQDKMDLESLCRSHQAETAQRWLNRMQWDAGHEKMITFGVALGVRGKANGVWCYYPSAPLDNDKATYYGMSMTWEDWARPIIEYLNDRRTELAAAKGNPQEQRAELFSRALDGGIMRLSYQNGLYLTLPGEEYKTLKEWVYQYLFDGRTSFPYMGDIPDGDYSFTVDFDTDIEIVHAYDLKQDMGQYNREHNAAHNKEMGRIQTEKRFGNLQGDAWTKQEILDQGFSQKTLDKFVKHGLIKRVKRGCYVRNSV